MLIKHLFTCLICDEYDVVYSACRVSIIYHVFVVWFFFFQAEDGIRYLVRSRGLGDVYKRQLQHLRAHGQS